MSLLRAESLEYGVEGTSILEGVDVELAEGEFVGLIGPNGSGKSTTIKCLAGVLTPDAGRIELDGRPLADYEPRERSRRVAMVGQNESIGFDFSVREIVEMGRSPHKELLELENQKDREIVEESLERVGMESFDDRAFRTLSGGEQQRVIVARCLAQQADLMLLDEPTNHLDVRYRMNILDLLHEIEPSVLIAIHDLNAAAQYCDRIVVMKDGRTREAGSPEEVLTAERIESVFGRPARVDRDPETDRPRVTFEPGVTVD